MHRKHRTHPVRTATGPRPGPRGAGHRVTPSDRQVKTVSARARTRAGGCPGTGPAAVTQPGPRLRRIRPGEIAGASDGARARPGEPPGRALPEHASPNTPARSTPPAAARTASGLLARHLARCDIETRRHQARTALTARPAAGITRHVSRPAAGISGQGRPSGAGARLKSRGRARRSPPHPARRGPHLDAPRTAPAAQSS
jgi:hypothetical protein